MARLVSLFGAPPVTTVTGMMFYGRLGCGMGAGFLSPAFHSRAVRASNLNWKHDEWKSF